MTIPQIKKLEKEILKHRNLYYSGKPTLDDNAYDLLEEELRALDPNNATLNKIGSTSYTKEEVELPAPMPSLNKIRDGMGADKWLLAHPGPYVISDKLDAVSIELEYQPGKQVRAFTRGDDGITGRDISYLTPHMDIPQRLNKKLIVRGEVILSKAAFRAYSDKYKNARNMVAGIVNKKTVSHATKDCHVVVYSCLYPRGTPSKSLEMVAALKFKVVSYKLAEKLTVATLARLLASRRKSSPYEIDGLVIEQDIKTAAPSSNPKNAVAFKENLFVGVKVLQVTWEPSRYGKLTPRIWVEPTELSGVTISKCTAHNAKFVFDNKIGPGAQIELTRSGEVIPKCEKVLVPAKKWSAPEGKEGVDWNWNESGVDIYLAGDHAEQDTTAVRALAHFFGTMDVDGMRQGTVQRLYSAGFTSIKAITTAKAKDWVELLGPNMAQKLNANMRAVFAEPMWLATVMYASGIFGRGVGSKKLWALWHHFGNDLATKKLTLTQIKPVFGGDVAATAIAAELPKFQQWLKQFPKWTWLEDDEEEVEPQSTKCEGVVVCLTGFRDAALSSEIEANSGTVVDGVSKNTTHLLVKDPSSVSSKVQKARDMGIPIMTPAEFKKKFKL